MQTIFFKNIGHSYPDNNFQKKIVSGPFFQGTKISMTILTKELVIATDNHTESPFTFLVAMSCEDIYNKNIKATGGQDITPLHTKFIVE